MKQLIGILEAGIRDTSDTPVSLGQVYFYEAGTTTLQTAYQDYAFTTPHANPATLDAYGKLTAYVDGRVKIVIVNSSGTTIDTIDHIGIEDDDIQGANTDSIAGEGLEAAPDGTINSVVDDEYIEINATNEHTLTGTAIDSLERDQAYEISNLSVACSVGSNALTIAFKTKAGADPSATDTIRIGFRNTTSATGDYTQVSATAAITPLVITSGSTLGLASGSLTEYVYVYAANNAGTIVPVVLGGAPIYEDNSVQSTTAEGAAGGADTRYTLYSTSALTSKALRLVARLKFTLATAGTWNEVPDEITLYPFENRYHTQQQIIGDSPNGHGSSSTAIRRWTNQTTTGTALTYADSATAGMTITVNAEGYVTATYCDARSGGECAIGWSINSAQLTTSIQSITAATRIISSSIAATYYTCASTGLVKVKPGDVLRTHTNTAPDASGAVAQFRVVWFPA